MRRPTEGKLLFSLEFLQYFTIYILEAKLTIYAKILEKLSRKNNFTYKTSFRKTTNYFQLIKVRSLLDEDPIFERDLRPDPMMVTSMLDRILYVLQ